MKNILYLSLILLSCNQQDHSNIARTTDKNTPTLHGSKSDKQLNLTILLDLSDRVDPKKYPNKPEHFQRDSALISYLTDYFLSQMIVKGTYMAKGKLRVIFHPNPLDPGINEAVRRLHIDLSRMDPKGKKATYETLKNTVSQSIGHIYTTTIQQAVWPGSDIWRFFKNDVKEMTIDSDSSYRNLLVIFTDGYLYHADSKDKEGNRYAYILPELFDHYKLRNNNQWADKINKLNLGLISKRSDLDKLEILVLEITPSAKHKNDEDIIRKIMDKWFSEMKVKEWKILNSDLPDVTKQQMERFLED